MHYKNGRLAKNGDSVVWTPAVGVPAIAGILYNAVPGNDSCNGRIAVTSSNDAWPNLAQVLHADDVASGNVPDSTVPPPAPPVDNANVAEGCEKFTEPAAAVTSPVPADPQPEAPAPRADVAGGQPGLPADEQPPLPSGGLPPEATTAAPAPAVADASTQQTVPRAKSGW